MRFQITSAGLMASLLGAASLLGQQDITIQQPVFNFSTVNTTVTAPDGGTALLGGVSRAAEGSNYRGVPMLSKIPGVNRLFQNRGIGREMSTWNMSVTPRIIILEEEEFLQTGVSSDTLSMDTGGLGGGQSGGQFGGMGTARTDPTSQKAAFLSRNVARYQIESPQFESPSRGAARDTPAVSQIRHQNEAAAAQRANEAVEYFAKAERAAAERKLGVARIYYQMAARRADPQLAQQIAARLARIDSPPSAAAPDFTNR